MIRSVSTEPQGTSSSGFRSIRGEYRGDRPAAKASSFVKADSAIKADFVITAKKVVVFPDRLEVTVGVRDESCRYASPSLVAACLRSFPELPYHACKNEQGQLFGDVLDQTSLPHLLEHLVITLQVRHDQKEDSDSFPYFGTTQWLPLGSVAVASEALILAKVSVRFRNDLVALSCLNEALAFVNAHF